MPSKRKITVARLGEEGTALVEALKKRLGLTTTGVIEIAVRRLAEAEGIRNGEKKARDEG